MDPSEFVKYIAGHPDLKPSATFEAFGGREAEMSTWSVAPRGNVFVFPEYFAFLTTRHFGGGWQLAAEQLGLGLAEYARNIYKIHRWAVDPTSIWRDLAIALGNKYRGRELVSKALTNQRSFSFPLSDLREVVGGGGIANAIRQKSWQEANRSPYFRLVTRDETYVVRMVPNLFWNYGIIKANYQIATSRWQLRALELLQAAAAKNTVR